MTADIAPFVTHTAEEVALLCDQQILILWAGAHEWIADGREKARNGRRQLKAVELEIKRRGIRKKPLADCI